MIDAIRKSTIELLSTSADKMTWKAIVRSSLGSGESIMVETSEHRGQFEHDGRSLALKEARAIHEMLICFGAPSSLRSEDVDVIFSVYRASPLAGSVRAAFDDMSAIASDKRRALLAGDTLGVICCHILAILPEQGDRATIPS